MPRKKSNVELIEKLPVIEITAGNKIKETPTEIAFSSEILDYGITGEIDLLLDREGYDCKKLRLTSVEIKTHVVGHREGGRCIYDGEKRKIDYSLKYDGRLDEKTKNGIVNILKSVPNVKI
jgi:hypothetical protein